MIGSKLLKQIIEANYDSLSNPSSLYNPRLLIDLNMIIRYFVLIYSFLSFIPKLIYLVREYFGSDSLISH